MGAKWVHTLATVQNGCKMGVHFLPWTLSPKTQEGVTGARSLRNHSGISPKTVSSLSFQEMGIIPIVSIVVPVWSYRLGSLIYRVG